MMRSVARSRLTQTEQLQRFGYLALALVPLFGSVSFNLGLQLSFLGCPLMRYLGVPCPGWGLTRSFMAVTRGDLSQAFTYHLFGPVLFALFVAWILHTAMELVHNRKISTAYGPTLRNPQFQLFCFALLLMYHSFRGYQLWQSGELYPSIVESPWGVWLFSPWL
jgi:hypothetical protein